MIFQPGSGGSSGGLSVVGSGTGVPSGGITLQKAAKFVLAAPGNGYDEGTSQMIMPGKMQYIIVGTNSQWIRISLSADGKTITIVENGTGGVDYVAIG